MAQIREIFMSRIFYVLQYKSTVGCIMIQVTEWPFFPCINYIMHHAGYCSIIRELSEQTSRYQCIYKIEMSVACMPYAVSEFPL